MKILPLFLCAGWLALTCHLSAAGAPEQPRKNYAIGRVTLEDGQAIAGDVDDIILDIYGVSEAGEKVQYTPAVKNGAYKQKLVPGQFAFNLGKIKVKFGEKVFTFSLTPVGKNWNKNQDAEDGIVQDWIWRPTGPAETYGAKPDPNNATHWHGMNVGLHFQGWRSDKKTSSARLPEGTKLVLTLTPTSKCIDGRELPPVTLERAWRPKDITPNDDLNDLPPANYEMTGVAQLPDGSSRPMFFQGRGDYPKFVAKAQLPLEPDGYVNGMWKQIVGWVTD